MANPMMIRNVLSMEPIFFFMEYPFEMICFVVWRSNNHLIDGRNTALKMIIRHFNKEYQWLKIILTY